MTKIATMTIAMGAIRTTASSCPVSRSGLHSRGKIGSGETESGNILQITVDGVYKLVRAHSGRPRLWIGAHALRATAATNALDHQADIAKVQEWLGHANIATTRIYDHRRTRPEDCPTFKGGLLTLKLNLDRRTHARKLTNPRVTLLEEIVMSGTDTEPEMLKRQIRSLDIYVSELQTLEEWNMPSEHRERALRIRGDSAPMFFNLVASLLQDALIQGIANILDKPATFGKDNLTLEHAIQTHSDPSIRASCGKELSRIRDNLTYSDIKKARNHILSHSDYATMINYNTMTPRDFPHLRLENFRLFVREIMQLISKVTGESVSNLIAKDWQGVSALFEWLEQAKG